MDSRAITSTEFSLPGQTALYHGKVRDVYTINDKLMISVATDRISAFDVVLPKPIPYKGQVLNRTAAYFLDKTSDIVPNWLKSVPDPNVSAGLKATPVKVEMVIRGVLVGHAWREYSAGKRELCGVPLPNGLKEYDAFSEPIITPTSKAETGHDEDLTEQEIIAQELSTPKEWDQLKDFTYKLFARGQQMARAQGLVLADTKYEFGTVDGQLILIDEVHTPDSSRYFYADSFDAFGAGKTDVQPKQLSKEFVREWLMTNGFDGKSDQSVPEMTDDFIRLVSDRYIELFEKVTGQKFVKDESPDILKRIESNVLSYLKDHA